MDMTFLTGLLHVFFICHKTYHSEIEVSPKIYLLLHSGWHIKISRKNLSKYDIHTQAISFKRHHELLETTVVLASHKISHAINDDA